jgi:epoxide hydrolase 4
MTASDLQTQSILANGQSLFTRVMGDAQAPLVLFLHGFPEYGGAWDALLPRFADQYFAVAPDQRGYGWSTKPTDVASYKVQHLANDMLALADALAPGKPIHLVSHDWGASVAYMMAFLQPGRIAKLVVMNGVHPLPFQRALIEDPEQRAASQYIGFLRRDDAAEQLLADDCRRALAFLTGGFGGGRWLTPELTAAYRTAWQQPGAMAGMVNWYKATPLVVPALGETVVGNPLGHINPASMRVRMPHLLLWGLEDKALRPSCRAGLADLCEDLTQIDIPACDHWIAHQQPERVTAEIRRFFGA